MTTFDVNAILSSTAYGSDGDKIGKVEQVFLDDNSGEPTFLTVNTGLFGAKENFVPVKGARQDGDRVVLPYTKDVIKDAPKVDADQHLSPAEEEELYRYYELNYNDDRTAGTDRDRTTAAAGTAGVAGTAADRDVADRDVADRDRDAVDQDRRDVAATAGDEASVVRHEERLNVGKERVESGRMRIRKHVVHDTETVEVPVEREEIHVERVPLDEKVAADDAKLSEGTQDIVTHEERPVVNKETVGVEKIKIGKEAVQDTETVSGKVAKEQIDIDNAKHTK